MIGSCFGTFLDPFQGQKCLKMSLQSSFWALIWAKSAPNLSKISLGPPKGPPGTPTAAQRRPGIDLGAFWAPFWGLLGCIFEPPRGSTLGAMLPSFLAFLPCFFPLLPSSLLRSSPSCLPFLPLQATKTPRSQERKQPRNVATQKPSHLGSAGARVSAYNCPIRVELGPMWGQFTGICAGFKDLC